MDKEQREQMQEIHIMPFNDCIEHVDSMECHCSPVHDGKNQWDIKEGIADKMVIMHTRIRDDLQ